MKRTRAGGAGMPPQGEEGGYGSPFYQLSQGIRGASTSEPHEGPGDEQGSSEVEVSVVRRWAEAMRLVLLPPDEQVSRHLMNLQEKI